MKVLFWFYFGSFIVGVFLINFWGEFASAQWYDYLLIIGCGLGFGISTTKHLKRMRTRTLNRKVDLGAEVISKDWMSRQKVIAIAGGVGYLLRDKLVFIPHKLNFSRKTVTIPLSEIESVSGYKVWKIFSVGVKITLKSGKAERFIVDHAGSFYSSTLMAAQAAKQRPGLA